MNTAEPTWAKFTLYSNILDGYGETIIHRALCRHMFNDMVHSSEIVYKNGVGCDARHSVSFAGEILFNKNDKRHGAFK